MTALLHQPAVEERETSTPRVGQPRPSLTPFAPPPFQEPSPSPRRRPRAPDPQPPPLDDENLEPLKSESSVETAPPEPARLASDKATLLAEADKDSWILQNTLFPKQLMYALSLTDPTKLLAVRVLLERFRRDAGASDDPLERLLLDQVYLTHLEIGQFHALASDDDRLEFKQHFANMAARLLGSLCQLVKTLSEYRAARQPAEKRCKSAGPKAKAD
jgi:hypothetical protein